MHISDVNWIIQYKRACRPTSENPTFSRYVIKIRIGTSVRFWAAGVPVTNIGFQVELKRFNKNDGWYMNA